jgi:hypothetical protein
MTDADIMPENMADAVTEIRRLQSRIADLEELVVERAAAIEAGHADLRKAEEKIEEAEARNDALWEQLDWWIERDPVLAELHLHEALTEAELAADDIAELCWHRRRHGSGTGRIGRPPTWTEGLRDKVRRLREEGVGVRQISMLTGISESTVKRIIAKAVAPVEKSPPKPDRAEIRDKRLLLRREEILAHVKKLKAATRAESQKPKRRQQAAKLIRR